VVLEGDSKYRVKFDLGADSTEGDDGVAVHNGKTIGAGFKCYSRDFTRIGNFSTE